MLWRRKVLCNLVYRWGGQAGRTWICDMDSRNKPETKPALRTSRKLRLFHRLAWRPVIFGPKRRDPMWYRQVRRGGEKAYLRRILPWALLSPWDIKGTAQLSCRLKSDSFGEGEMMAREGHMENVEKWVPDLSLLWACSVSHGPWGLAC